MGATFTDNVHSYEAMKLRLLNAGHQIIATPAELLSVETIAGAMAHPLISALFHKIAREEIVPHVAAVPGMAPQEYVDLIAARFANPEIRDTTRRVAFDGAARHAGFLHPIIRDALAGDAPIEGLALIEALWARMCCGSREDATPIAPNDPAWHTLTTAANAARQTPQTWIAQTQCYGSLGQNKTFAKAFHKYLKMIHTKGTENTIKTYLNEEV
ncbi:Mannitol 2-dehydrogenase [Roseobacter fucihabitans]|uniref:Mannitol 2-dehydrogenase n=1 Tax=Roseobacter fucihabitans TaxID=1537242 RepID=A0ABZ2BNV4_9RHOB|nr:Mannitol 2-dehydrogenase [Roseobacter litoralis]MBC6966580.1 Mannitol 2-dehydrogenase [Roseobacter litoralis]